MALYSWFSRTDKKSGIKSSKVNNNLLSGSDTVKYIENYTMWPTAKIKPTHEVIVPTYVDRSLNKPTATLPTDSQLTVIKG